MHCARQVLNGDSREKIVLGSHEHVTGIAGVGLRRR
jgi:hypothetical protein